MFAEVQAELLNSLFVIITALIGIVTQKATVYLKQKGVLAKLEAHKELVRIVVSAIEQIYSDLDGREKLNVAKLEIVKMMNEKRIRISEKEIDVLIESVVKEMKDNYNQVK